MSSVFGEYGSSEAFAFDATAVNAPDTGFSSDAYASTDTSFSFFQLDDIDNDELVIEGFDGGEASGEVTVIVTPEVEPVEGGDAGFTIPLFPSETPTSTSNPFGSSSGSQSSSSSDDYVEGSAIVTVSISSSTTTDSDWFSAPDFSAQEIVMDFTTFDLADQDLVVIDLADAVV